MDILKDFGVQPILLAAQVVNFLVLLWILNKLLYKPILKVLKERRAKIEQSLKQAEEIELQLQKSKEQSEKMITKTLEESQKILDNTNQVAAQILEDTHKAAEQILMKASEEAKKFVEREKIQMISQVKDNLSDIVQLGLEKIWGRKKTAEQRKVIEEVVKES